MAIFSLKIGALDIAFWHNGILWQLWEEAGTFINDKKLQSSVSKRETLDAYLCSTVRSTKWVSTFSNFVNKSEAR
jgi:hypothetical protein